jgi:hypothetical protein
MKNGTWDLTELPEGKKAIGSKWVFCIKRKANGEIKKYCVRLIAKKFFQTKGLNSHETFAYATKKNSIRMLLALVATLEVH